MSTTRDLIAAALTLADIDEHVAEMPTQAATDVRELCARAMVQPDMAEVRPGMSGWKGATIAWEVCASIHREYAKKKDPFFTTRQADFVKHAACARAMVQPDGWQPIDTAPKDRSILLYCPRGGVVRGVWADERFSKNPKPYWKHDRTYLFGIRETRDDQPTHWMPLPESPK